MKISNYIKTICLFITLTVVCVYAHGQTISFRPSSDVLVDTYKSNGGALSQIGAVIKANKTDILNGNGYVELSALVDANSFSNNFTLNTAAMQASVVRAYLKSKYGLDRNNYFVFQYEKSDESNSVNVRYVKGTIPASAQQSIYYTPETANTNAVNSAIAKYGNNIPTQPYAENSKITSAPAKPTTTAAPIKETPPVVAKSTEPIIHFRHGSETLYGALNDNKVSLASIRSMITEKRAQLDGENGHIRLTALIPSEQRGNLAALNLASIRASVVREYLKNNYPSLSDTCFTFFIDPNGKDDAILVEFITDAVADATQCEIWYSLTKGYPEKVEYAMSHYKRIPFLDGSELFETPGMDFDAIDPILDKTVTTKIVGMTDEKVSVTIYYRWDKDTLDKTYLDNTETLIRIDSLLTNEDSKYIDSLVIVAYASPEGRPAYNQALSQRRANTIKQYILENYPKYKEDQIITIARGENWDGFRRMAIADPNLPMKEQVLSIIDNPNLDDVQRQSMITRLDGGRLYKNYILPNYYRYLRLGASLFVVYTPGKPVEIDFEPIKVEITEPVFIPIVIEPIIVIDTTYRYPIAFRTNLLYDAVGALNIGIELPYGREKNWSFIADVAYAYWRSPKNLYALQTLEYGIENRYWFGVSKQRQEQKKNWSQPLKGWYMGIYGKYWQRYDVQWIDGVQGDGTWSAGLTAGYAIPLNRSLSFDFGIGAGWVSTSEYRHYHQPEYDANGKYHLMWQQTGRWSGLSITKVRFALVWLIQTTKTQERRIAQ